ncbi:MAG: hypothetical protein K9K33_19085 [Desulfarculaceae bacterium]|nr:hypothetical protein [Desulfarculaceae bacterium]
MNLTKKKKLEPNGDVLLGMVDFSFNHYALGDILTTEIYLALEAAQRGCKHIDIIVTACRSFPVPPHQPHLTLNNFRSALYNIFPAFLCTPSLRAVTLLRDRQRHNYALRTYIGSNYNIWPAKTKQIHRHSEYPLSHHSINKFYMDTGYIPHLEPPRGYANWAKSFLRDNFPGRIVVVINPRQSSLTSAPACTYRDAPLAEWYRFLDHANDSHPEAIFIMVGGYNEWEHTLAKKKNVFIPRSHGWGLAQELAILHLADVFIGTSSGFATYATFSDQPYLILNVEHAFADFAGVKVGDERYPFGKRNQTLTWTQESAREMIEFFEMMYGELVHKTAQPEQSAD